LKKYTRFTRVVYKAVRESRTAIKNTVARQADGWGIGTLYNAFKLNVRTIEGLRINSYILILTSYFGSSSHGSSLWEDRFSCWLLITDSLPGLLTGSIYTRLRLSARAHMNKDRKS